MCNPIVFMYSGQGSQYYSMGKELYQNSSRFKLWMDHCDECVANYLGVSLVDILYSRDSKGEPFDDLLYTNPALVSIEYSLTRVLMEEGIKPDYLLGYSLGEIVAATVAGVFDLDEALQLVIELAKLVESDTPKAAMLAVFAGEDELTEILHNDRVGCWLSAKNFDNNVVFSGLEENITALQAKLNERDVLNQRLPVQYGFHSQLVDPIELSFKELVRQANLSEGNYKMLSSVTGLPIADIDEDYIWEVLRQPVNFSRAVKKLLQQGDYTFIDVGPSGMLSTFVKYLLPNNSNSRYFETINQFGSNLSSFSKLTQNLGLSFNDQ